MHTAHCTPRIYDIRLLFGDVEVTVELRGANRVIHVVWKTGVNIVPSPVTCSAVITQTVRAPITWGGSKSPFRYACVVGRDQPMDDRFEATPLVRWAGERRVALPFVCVEAAVW
jgi:hypothetical protein